MTRQRLLGLGALLGSALGFLLLFASLNPLRVHDSMNLARLRWSGVREFRSGPVAGLLRDTCRPEAPCRCAALLHGLGDTAATWRRILSGDDAAPVPAGWRLYALDMPGTGASAAPAAGYAQPEQARLIRSALKPLCPNWTVVGNSLGGWTAGWLAVEWPQGVERLVLLSPAGLGDPSGASESTARTLASPDVAVLREFNKRVTHVERKIPDRAFEEMAALLKDRPVRDNLIAIRPEHFLEGKLRALTMPVSVLWGQSDRVILPSQAEAFRRELPNATIDFIPSCGHLPQTECPAPVRAALFAK